MTTTWTMTVPVLSTGHLQFQSNEQLSAQNPRSHLNPLLFAAYPHGFFLYFGEAHSPTSFDLEPEPLKTDLTRLAQWLHEHYPDSAWLRLDADGDKVEGLPVFNW